MFTISGIHVIHIHELEKSYRCLCGHFRWYKYINCRPWRTEYLFVTPLHNKRRATVSRDKHWTRNRCQQPRTSTRNDVMPSVDALKFISYLRCWPNINWHTNLPAQNVILIRTSQWQTSQSLSGHPDCIYKLWLGLVLTTGRSSITTFVFTWTGDCVRVYTCTQKIANTCDRSSSPPLDDAMIFQAPPFAFHVHYKTYCSMNNYR